MFFTGVLIVVAILAALALTYFALHKIKPESFKLRASILRLFSLDLEIQLSERWRAPGTTRGQPQITGAEHRGSDPEDRPY